MQGFDNFGNDSLLGLQTNVFGQYHLSSPHHHRGLGFMVWFDLATKWEEKTEGLHFHTKVVLLLTVGLSFLGQLQSLDSYIIILERLAVSFFWQ